MLGRARISTTLDLYSHVKPTMQREGTEALDAVLDGADCRAVVGWSQLGTWR
ncbi:MAG: hypothetical protein IH958_03950 [Chloroflexi bacterium]|nr:hypothetical protein [Chloroflexota bacterium]